MHALCSTKWQLSVGFSRGAAAGAVACRRRRSMPGEPRPRQPPGGKPRSKFETQVLGLQAREAHSQALAGGGGEGQGAGRAQRDVLHPVAIAGRVVTLGSRPLLSLKFRPRTSVWLSWEGSILMPPAARQRRGGWVGHGPASLPLFSHLVLSAPVPLAAPSYQHLWIPSREGATSLSASSLAMPRLLTWHS